MLEDIKSEHCGVDIIGCTCTNNLGHKWVSKRCTTERLKKRDENISKSREKEL